MRAKILIVDDEPIARRAVELVLRHKGFECTSADGGQQATELLQSEAFDVAVVDLMMPGMDGFQVLQWMRDHAPRVVPVVLSATACVEDALRSVQEGAFDFVSKPIESFEVFAEHVARAARHKKLQDDNARLLDQVQEKNIELENRLSQLELAHSILQSQAMAIQIDLNRAMRIQYGLLPRKLPLSDRVSMSVVYHPLAKVGGDLYDVFALDDHRLGFYLADTSGHGVSSALLTVFLKHAFDDVRARLASEGKDSPGDVLSALNRVILDEAFGQGIFVSMTYVVLDTATGVFLFASAGHPAMLLRRADGAVERVHWPASVLGVNPRIVYTSADNELRPGDMLALYTDGITEMRNVYGEFFGEDRAKDVLARSENHADIIAETMEREVFRFGEGRQRTDDVTLVVVGAEPQRTPFRAPHEEVARPVDTIPAGAKIAAAHYDGRLFITVSGTGSWRESQYILNLCEKARESGENSVIVDFSRCVHLDSTFLGVLHNITAEFGDGKDGGCHLELQNLPRSLLKEMSDLGLTGVLMHFRHAPVPLPESMQPIEGTTPSGEEMGRLLLWAHEALVQADPSNADRFAAVLQVLHEQVRAATDHPKPNPEP